MTTHLVLPDWLPTNAELTGPVITAALAALALLVAVAVGIGWLIRRAVRAVARSAGQGTFTGRRVLITVAIIAAGGVAVIGGARSFNAVSDKFNSPLVPLVADGMIIACTALRLAALTRGWRIPGALVTTYVFIGGTVWLNIDTATGIADAVAHALAPIAYAVLVEMLAHMLRLHMKLAQPAKPRLSALTWFTSPVITTRVWLHLARTGTDDPVSARALVQQVVRMESRLATVCPSRVLWPLDAARSARTAALQTVRDGLLTAGELAALLPAVGRMTAGELLALVDTAALGLAERPTDTERQAGQFPAWLVGVALANLRTDPEPAPADDESGPGWLPWWMVGYLTGALGSSGAPQHSNPSAPAAALVQPAPTAPVHNPSRTAPAAPVHVPHRTTERTETVPVQPSDERTDAELLAVVHHHSTAEHNGGPMTQRAIRRVTGVGTQRAKRLAELAGWVEPKADDPASEMPQTKGQLQLISNPSTNTTDLAEPNKHDHNDQDQQPNSQPELETSHR